MRTFSTFPFFSALNLTSVFYKEAVLKLPIPGRSRCCGLSLGRCRKKTPPSRGDFSMAIRGQIRARGTCLCEQRKRLEGLYHRRPDWLERWQGPIQGQFEFAHFELNRLEGGGWPQRRRVNLCVFLGWGIATKRKNLITKYITNYFCTK